MSKTMEAIETLRAEKINILEHVYETKNLETVYERQTALNAMSGTIYTDAGDVMLPALKDDGYHALVWSKISGKLDRMSFIGIPSAEKIKEAYRASVSSSIGDRSQEYVIKPQQFTSSKPKVHEKIGIQKLTLPEFLSVLAGEGIAIPLVLELFNGESLHVLAKIIPPIIGIAIVVEIIHYFDVFNLIKGKNSSSKKSNMQSNNSTHQNGNSIPSVDWNVLYIKAIEQVKRDNLKELNRWFDNLKKVTETCLAESDKQGV